VICPKMVRNLKKVDTALENRYNILFNMFSVDPARDSVQQLKAFAERFAIHSDWNLLTGNKATIYKLARKSFAVTAEDGDGGEHDFIHSDKLVLIDARQQIRGYYSGTLDKDIQQLIQDIKKLHNEK
jgi:protein SCO1/2